LLDGVLLAAGDIRADAFRGPFAMSQLFAVRHKNSALLTGPRGDVIAG
jgi:hypothetical protein